VSATQDVARMLTLVPWLLERPGATLTEAADAFGVSAEVIRRDLAHLDFCGLPGLGGGDLFDVTLVGDRIVVSMADELRRPLRPTADEALRLVLTVDAVADALGDDLPPLRSAAAKVRDALGIPQDVADVLEDDPSHRALMQEALRERRRVRLRYQGRGDDRPALREVDPWSLHVQDGAWYLQGFDHGVGEGRTFRLDRASEIEVLDVTIEHPRPASVPPPRYAPAPDDPEVVLEVTSDARWIEAALTVDRVEELPQGGARLTFRTNVPRWIARLVLMAGGGAVVLAPTEIRDEVVRLATRALQAS